MGQNRHSMATTLALTTMVVEVKNKVAYDTPKVSRVMPKKRMGSISPTIESQRNLRVDNNKMKMAS